MLRSVVPQSIERVMIDLARLDQSGNHWLFFVILLGAYLILLGCIIRAVLLRLDVMLALRARLAGEMPGTHVFIIGNVGRWMPWALAGIALFMIAAEAVISLDRNGFSIFGNAIIHAAQQQANWYWR